jgi:peptide/nickel transport system permease protein
MTAAELTFGTEELPNAEEQSQAAITWRRFRRHRLAVIGMALIVGLFLFSFIGPLISPYGAIDIPTEGTQYADCRDLGLMSRCANGFHLLGTDTSSRDYLTRLMQAGRVSLTLAIVVTILSQTVGTVVGGISGYLGGWVDSSIMRSVDFLLTLPLIPLLLVMYMLIPPASIPGGSMVVVSIVLVVFGWMGTSRLVRGTVLSLRNQEFTEASKALGASSSRIITRHMLPNSLAPVIVAATLGVGGIVILEAALSYLGFGVQPPQPSWGNMLRDVQSKMFDEPLKVFYPGILIFLTSLSFNFVGDALRDALDPRLKK